MNLIKSYSLVQSDNDYDLILYFDAGPMDVEFASEFGGLDKDNASLNLNIMQEVLENFPDKKINTVKIMVGSALLSSSIIASPISTLTSEATSTQTQSVHNYNVNILVSGKA